jgi:hypothetical protein
MQTALAYDWNKVLKNNGEEIYILEIPHTMELESKRKNKKQS